MRSSKKKKEESRIIITGIVLAVLVVIICTVGFVFLRRYISYAENNSSRRYQRLSEEMRNELQRKEEVDFEPEVSDAVSEVIQGDAQVIQAPQVTVLPYNQLLLPEQGGLPDIGTNPVPFQEPVAVSLMPSVSANVAGYYPVGISQAAASSTIYIPGADTSVEMMFDANFASSWQEGVDGYGEGSIVNAQFDRIYYTKYVLLRLGNWENTISWDENTTPENITVWIGGNGYSINFPHEMTEWVIEFSEEVVASEISFTINSVYPGQYPDTCIADAIIYGR